MQQHSLKGTNFTRLGFGFQSTLFQMRAIQASGFMIQQVGMSGELREESILTSS